MDSIYHIDTDLECRVLHYGKEVCVATPGEDVSIELRRGRHKLAFVSTENDADQYSIVFEVPENDIEDCIDVQLAPYRDERLCREREQAEEQERIRQKEAEEQERIRREEEEERRLEREKIEEEKRRRIQFELEQKELAEKREKERIERQKEVRKRKLINSALSFAENYDEMFWGSWREDKNLSPFYDEDTSLNPKIGFNATYGNECSVSIHLRYRCQMGYPWNDRLHEGLVGVMNESEALTYSEKHHIIPLLMFGYIDMSRNIVIPFKYYAGTPFAYDRAFVLEADLKDEVTRGVTQVGLEYLSKIAKKESLVSVEPVRDDDSGNLWYRLKYPRLHTGKWKCINKRGEAIFYLRNQSWADCRCIPFPFSQGFSIALWIKEASEYSLFNSIIVAINVVDINGNEIFTLNTQDKNLFYDNYTIPVFTNGLALITTKPYSYLTVNGYLTIGGRDRASQYIGISDKKIYDADMCSIHSIYSRTGYNDDSWNWSKPKYR